MPAELNPVEYAAFLRGKWRVVVIACAVAAVLAAAVSLLLPVRYTATARIFIEPPAGSDVRASVAVSPIYLESLKTFEYFAASDSLFREALEHFGLRKSDPERTIESWKKSVLEVSIPRNTRILEISVTLPDPKTAQRMAEYIGERTVESSREVTRMGDTEIVGETEELRERALADREKAETGWSRFLRAGGTSALESEIASLEMQQYRLRRSLADAEVRVAERSGSEGGANQVRELRRQLASLDEGLKTKRELLARRSATQARLRAERVRTREALSALDEKLREVMSAVGFRGERLRLIDPGIVPERPSSPNLPLNVFGAMFFALVISLGYLTLEFSLGRGSRERKAALVEIPSKARND